VPMFHVPDSRVAHVWAVSSAEAWASDAELNGGGGAARTYSEAGPAVPRQVVETARTFWVGVRRPVIQVEGKRAKRPLAQKTKL